MTDPTIAAQAPLRVLVVDPDDQIRESLTRLLPIGGRCLVVGSAGQPVDALALAKSSAPDVVVLDCRLPELGADRDFVERIRAVAPGVRVLVLNRSDGAESQTILRGADAYIRKTFRPHELIDAVVGATPTSIA